MPMNFFSRTFVVAAALVLTSVPSLAQSQTQARVNDIPAKFTLPRTDFDYTKRVEMVPMRDGVKLYTVIVVPKGAARAPMILTRTPYDAAGRTQRLRGAGLPHNLGGKAPGDGGVGGAGEHP